MAALLSARHKTFPVRPLGVLLLSVAFLAGGAAEARHHFTSATSGPHLTSEITGSLPAHDGDRIRLSTDLGSIVVHSQNSGKVDYRVHLEADAAQKDAPELLKSFTISAHDTAEGIVLSAHAAGHHSTGRLWVTLELNIPKGSSLDVSTGGGNIDADQVDGRATLSTAGGNITAGSLGGAARLETGGGNIDARSAGGELTAETGGGHITIGSVAGNANLHTSGGHIRVASIQGVAHLSTGGGNITLEHSGADLSAETGGGEIEVGEAAGLVRAKTAGGGIRVVRMFGPTDLQTAGGSIYLTQVDSPVKASTEAGGITAWCVSPAKTGGAIDLQSTAGDIVVHIPREMAVTVDARIQMGSDHQLIVDPAFPLKVSYDDSAKGTRAVRAEGALNGGGELLRLRAVAGNIQLLLSDTSKQAQLYKQQMEKLSQRVQPEVPGATGDDSPDEQYHGDVARIF
jgi:DUF4097 and DUF4098 domain-containing protein YvlB